MNGWMRLLTVISLPATYVLIYWNTSDLGESFALTLFLLLVIGALFVIGILILWIIEGFKQ